jgi:hypothetical protein
MMTSCLLRFTHFIIPDHSKSIIWMEQAMKFSFV